MEVKRYDMIVVGAGPAGLSAAIEAAKHGVKPIVFDENARPGGQLFEQIHKFFGSKEHKAKIRGFKIGEELLAEAEKYGVDVVLNATVVGLYPDKEVTVRIAGEVKHFKGDSILIATGASENMVNFKGWTLPGVIGAGAAQTMMNLHHILLDSYRSYPFLHFQLQLSVHPIIHRLLNTYQRSLHQRLRKYQHLLY